MKRPSKSHSVIGPAVLLALFAAGTLAARVLALPLPAPVLGLALVLLGLRIGVMTSALDEPAGQLARPLGRTADAGEPRLRAANG
jgi:putative effector of murein hydrolase LrgA (UPF0299 family)